MQHSCMRLYCHFHTLFIRNQLSDQFIQFSNENLFHDLRVKQYVYIIFINNVDLLSKQISLVVHPCTSMFLLKHTCRLLPGGNKVLNISCQPKQEITSKGIWDIGHGIWDIHIRRYQEVVHKQTLLSLSRKSSSM